MALAMLLSAHGARVGYARCRMASLGVGSDSDLDALWEPSAGTPVAGAPAQAARSCFDCRCASGARSGRGGALIWNVGAKVSITIMGARSAGRRRLVARCGRLLGFGAAGGPVRQATVGRAQVVFRPALASNPLVPDPMDPPRQALQQEATHEFGGGQGHRLVALPALSRYPSSGSNAALVKGDERPLEIATRWGSGTGFQDGLGPANGRLRRPPTRSCAAAQATGQKEPESVSSVCSPKKRNCPCVVSP